MRDIAVGAFAALLRRPDWRTSDVAPLLITGVSAALHDENRVVRMRAAEAVGVLYTDVDPAQRAAAIGDLVLDETDPTVRAVLIDQLATTVVDASDTVDVVLERLLEQQHEDRTPEVDDAEVDVTDMNGPRGDLGRGVLGLLTYLALVPHTPFASRTVERWCAGAPNHAARVQVVAQCARNHLGPIGSAGQSTAFRLLHLAAQASLTRWTRNPDESSSGADLGEDQLAEIRGAVEVAHEVAQQIYFASGAFDVEQGQQRPPAAELSRFAELALPVLSTCTALRDPQCVQDAVQTMVFLAPHDERTMLLAIADAVPPDGPYASDALAGGVVIPYLERLLAEERRLVLFDPDGVAAFRYLLATFAAAGDQAALGLAYTFAEVFR